MLGMIAVRRYLAVLEAHGYPEQHLLSEAGLPHVRLGDPAALLSANEYRRLINTLMAVSGREGLELALSAFHDLGDLGIVGHASASSPTVRDTWRVWSRFGPSLVGMMGRLRIVGEDLRSVTMTVADPDPADPLFRFSVEELLTMVRKVSRAPLEDAPSVGELSLSYAAPKHADRYAELFGCPLRFGARQTAIRVWKEWFDGPSVPHDEELHSICIQHCERVQRRMEDSTPTCADLQRMFASIRDEPLPKLEGAARRLNLTPRTLRRRLHDEGTSYRTELDLFRAERARACLADGGVEVKELAYLLGFREQSAFRHAFKAWTGMTVGEYRQQHGPRDRRELH